jgi:hypothetical protein
VPIKWLLREVASVTRIARPSPPPTWREVLTRPEASPACPCLEPCVAAIVEGTIDIAIPAAVSSPGIMMYTIGLPLEPTFASSSIPAVNITRPPPSTGRTPKWLTSLPVREATSMITNVIGRNTRPVSSGDRYSTCCRYRELTNHSGNSDALNSSTMLLATRSDLVSSLKGISGSEARRASITPNTASRTTPATIGPSAAGVSQPARPASTIP